jgi:hypothetical protein
MPSPFPGMDPYLERGQLWPLFHHHLIHSLNDMLGKGLDRYRPRVNQRHYVTEQALFTSIVREEHHEEFLEIRQRGDGRVVTLIEVVSPANKTTVEGRQAYLERRRSGRSVGANLVEIDLVLQGQPTLEYSREGLPEWDYAVTVTRPAHPEKFEIYTATLQKPLPKFRLPLLTEDRDTSLDLQLTFTRCFDQGGFAAKINYAAPPAVPLIEEDQRWLEEWLKKQKVR